MTKMTESLNAAIGAGMIIAAARWTLGALIIAAICL